MEKNASIIGFIGLLVLVVFFSGCTSNNTTSNQIGDVMVQISANNPWNGTLTYIHQEYHKPWIKTMMLFPGRND